MNANKPVTLRTDNLRAAVGLAAAVRANPKFKHCFRFASSELAVEALNMLPEFTGEAESQEGLQVPADEADLQQLDEYGRMRLQAEVEEIMGVISEEDFPLNRLHWGGLADEWMCREFGLLMRGSGFTYLDPKFLASEYKGTLADLVFINPESEVQDMDAAQQAGAFARAYLDKDPVSGLDLSTTDLWSSTIALAAHWNANHVIALPIDHPLMYVARAWYPGCEHLSTVPAVLGLGPKQRAINDRDVINWAQMIFLGAAPSTELSTLKGRSWKFRKEHNFSTHEMWRQQALKAKNDGDSTEDDEG